MNNRGRMALGYVVWALLALAVLGDAMMRDLPGDRMVLLLIGVGLLGLAPLLELREP